MGAQVVREVSMQTNAVAGDGTTTAIVLANALVQAGTEAPDAARRRSTSAVASSAPSKACSPAEGRGAARVDEGPLAAVATVAATDPTLGALVAEAYARSARRASSPRSTASPTDTTLDVVEGMAFDRGYLSHHMVTDQETMTAALERPLILMTDLKIKAPAELDAVRALAKPSETAPVDRSPKKSRRRSWRACSAAARRAASSSCIRRNMGIGARRCSRTWRSSPAVGSSRAISAAASKRSTRAGPRRRRFGQNQRESHCDPPRRRRPGRDPGAPRPGAAALRKRAAQHRAGQAARAARQAFGRHGGALCRRPDAGRAEAHSPADRGRAQRRARRGRGRRRSRRRDDALPTWPQPRPLIAAASPAMSPRACGSCKRPSRGRCGGSPPMRDATRTRSSPK